jgi:hypothetical protein
MWTTSFPYLLVNALAAIFGGAALIGMAGSRYLRERFGQWRYPGKFYRVMGLLQLFTALCLALPPLRVWGIVLAGIITFVWVVNLLNHRQWRWAAAGMVLLMALPPASLALY